MKTISDDVIDFSKYMETPIEYANVKQASNYSDDIIELFQNPLKHNGVVLPWSSTNDKIRIRPSELSIWAGVNGHGKALSVDTSIPTPSGFKTMAEITLGDAVFDEKGATCNVVAVTETLKNRECYKITFSDMTEIVCDGNHQWLTSTIKSRRSLRNAKKNNRIKDRELKKFGSDQSDKRTFPSVVRTKDIFDTASINNLSNHSVAVAGEIELRKRNLPIEPYLLGLWLGDGDSSGAGYTTSDVIVLDAFKNAGFVVTDHKAKYHYDISGGFKFLLRVNGQINNKHIPDAYLRASASQRLSLLQGLMDSDGSITPYGRCELTQVRKHIIDSALDLALSLGIKARVISGDATIDGVFKSKKYRLTFTTNKKVFRLERHLKRLKKEISVKAQHRFIISCEKVESVPVKCIQVDSESHLYLATKAYIPTHNSILLSMICLWQMAYKQKICIASMEMEPKKTLYRMARQFVGGESASEFHLKKFSKWTDDKLWLYDQVGTVKFDRMLALIRYCKEEIGIDQFVIDSLMKCSIGSEDYGQQKSFIDELSTLAKDTGIHIHLVAHSRKKESEHQRIGKFDIKGCSEITDMPDNVFTLWRNKKKEEDIAAGKEGNGPDAILVCDKQRHGEWEGKIGLSFQGKSLQFQTGESFRPYIVPFTEQERGGK